MGNINFGDAYTQNEGAIAGNVLPEGEYDVEVKSAKAVTTSGGKEAIRLSLVVIAGPHAGRTLPDQQTWSPESEVAIRIFSQSLATLGATREWIVATGANADQIADKIVGARARIFAGIGEWQGQKRNNVAYKTALTPSHDDYAAIPTEPAAATTAPAWP